jgi:hypothetical protein
VAAVVAVMVGAAGIPLIDPIGQVEGWRDLWEPCDTAVSHLIALGRNPAFDLSPRTQAGRTRAFATLLPVLVRVVDEPGFGDNLPALAGMSFDQYRRAMAGEPVVPYGLGARQLVVRVEAAAAEGWTRSAAGAPLELWRVRLMDLLANSAFRAGWDSLAWGVVDEPLCTWESLTVPLPTARVREIPFPTTTPVPTATPTPTPTRTPGPSATPPPRVQVVVTPQPTAAALASTITARTGGCTPDGQLQGLRFTRLTNATVELLTVPPQTVSAPGLVPLAARPATIALTVRRVQAGGPSTVELVVLDGCGEWPTFIGGGATAF